MQEQASSDQPKSVFADRYEYYAVSKWTGWWGGWGSERDIAGMINRHAADGWRLARSESGVFFWWLMPRHKVLLVFERTVR